MFPRVQVIGIPRLSRRIAALEQPEETLRLLAQIVLATHGKQLQTELSQEPGPVVYPINWTSPKQALAYLWTNGFGAGIPTERTHELSTQWKVQVEFINGRYVITVRNPAPHRKYVMGVRQQRFHKTTGWLNERQTFAKHRALMSQEFVKMARQRFIT